MIIVKQGDLLQATEDIICHQVNCKGVMGGGIALQIKKKYPHTYEVYRQTCELMGSALLGTCQIVTESNGKYIANLYGQDDYGTYKRMTSYRALTKCLFELRDRAERDSLSIALPYNIGCGLAGGDWNIVSGIIDDIFYDYDATLYRFG